MYLYAFFMSYKWDVFEVWLVFGYFLQPCRVKIIILMFFLFIKNFESPKTYLPIKSYANCKLHTFQTLNLESLLLYDVPSNVFMKFWPFWFWKLDLYYSSNSYFPFQRSNQNFVCQVKVMVTFPKLVNYLPFPENELVWNATCPIFLIWL